MIPIVSVEKTLAVCSVVDSYDHLACAVALQTGFPLLSACAAVAEKNAFRFLLCVDESGWYLVHGKSRIQVDFSAGANHHRRLQGGGRGQLIAKAVGLKTGNKIPTVLDATAGLGRDAFVLASLGCCVSLYERSPLVFQLLQDGLSRAAHADDVNVKAIVARMHLQSGEALSLMRQLPDDQRPDVVYLDPMFPDRRKTAAVKKDMAAFHVLLGADDDAHALLDVALEKALYRVVVKRPRNAPNLAGKRPSLVFEGDSTRFDVYTLRSLGNSNSITCASSRPVNIG